MSEFRIDQITNQEGTAGPQIAGITTFSSSSGLLMPSGTTAKRYIPSNIVDSNLLLYLDAGIFNSYPGSGTLWRDLSGNNNNGTLINGVGYDTSYGGGLNLDGVDDYVLIGDTVRPANITVSSWFSATSLLDGRLARWRFYGFGLDLNSKGGLNANIWDSISTNPYLSSQNNLIETNKIYNAVMTFGGNTLRLYLNGVLLNSLTAIGNTNTIYYASDGTGLTLSKEGGSVGGYILAKYYNFSIYDRALDPSEIRQNYNALRRRFGL